MQVKMLLSLLIKVQHAYKTRQSQNTDENARHSKSDSLRTWWWPFITQSKISVFNLLLYVKWLIFGYSVMRLGADGENTGEVIYDALETEAVRGSWLCTYWLLQVSEFICYASSIAGLLPEGHTTVIQRAASTSGACGEERDSDRFGVGKEGARKEWEGSWGCRRRERVGGWD